MLTLKEAILHAEEVAEENENVVNTGTFEDGWTVAEMYCDDTECINAHLSRCAKRAEEHRQLAEWLKDYKRLLEQGPVLDKIRAEIENHCGLLKEDHCKYCHHCNSVMGVREILEIIDKYKTESEEE